jgi:tetratricopeptide (TPR) repeat protein
VLEQLVHDHPKVSTCRVDLGGTYCNLAKINSDHGDPLIAISWFNKAITVLDAASFQESNDFYARQFLRNANWGRANAMEKLGRFADADFSWAKAIDLSPLREKRQVIAERDAWRAKRQKEHED